MADRENQQSSRRAVQTIVDSFAADFAVWAIQLPADAVRTRAMGEIRSQGWRIRYLFGHDERGEYLDYYASHRMADDRHARIYASGERCPLPAIVSAYIYDPRIPGDKERQEQAYFARNRLIGEQLRQEGFSDDDDAVH